MKINKTSILLAILILSVFAMQTTALAADNFSSGGTVSPEQDIYYVGETVDISDIFKNKSGTTATSVKVEYYYRLDGANSVYSGSPISFGTVSAGSSESYSFSYTFEDSDIGDYRIGAKITYTMGGTTYSEYSSGHDFIVIEAPAPTPTVTPTSTPTASPTATPTPNTPTPAPTPEPTAEPTPTAAPEETAAEPANTESEPQDTEPKKPVFSELISVFKENKVLTISAIVFVVSLTGLITLIIIMARKKR